MRADLFFQDLAWQMMMVCCCCQRMALSLNTFIVTAGDNALDRSAPTRRRQPPSTASLNLRWRLSTPNRPADLRVFGLQFPLPDKVHFLWFLTCCTSARVEAVEHDIIGTRIWVSQGASHRTDVESLLNLSGRVHRINDRFVVLPSAIAIPRVSLQFAIACQIEPPHTCKVQLVANGLTFSH